MKVLLLIFTIWISLNVLSQQSFEKVYYENSGVTAYSIIPTNDNSYVITGFSNITNTNSGLDIVLLKIDSVGNYVWGNNYGLPDLDERGIDVIQTFDNGFLIVGGVDRYDPTSNFYMMKTNNDGILEWEKYLDGDFFWGQKVIQNSSDSGFLIACNQGDFPVLIRTDQAGDTIWTKTWGDTINIKSVAHTIDSGFIVCGAKFQSIELHEGYIAKVDNNGTILWEKTVGGAYYDYFEDIITLPDSGYIACGRTYSFGAGQYDGYLVRFDQYGDTVWTQTYGIPFSDEFYSINTTPDGGFIVGGSRYTPAESENMYLVKVDSLGNEQWEKNFGYLNGGNQYGRSVCLGHDSGYLIAGSNSDVNGIGIYVVKTDLFGNTSLEIDEIMHSSLSIYPNPSTGTIKLVGDHLIRSISVFDPKGVEIKHLSQLLSDSIELNIQESGNGVFIIQVETNGNLIRERVVINR